MKKAIIYARTNYWGEWADINLSVQEKSCRRHAEAYGYTVIKIFRDKSYRRREGRRQLPQLFQYLQNNPNKVDALFIAEQKVLAAHWPDYLALRERLKTYGVKIESIKYRLKR
ncbi:MAG: recombinase family protein [Candidatus Adlerbacteria bacterium]|nr:recombinase family protein [Candidatus Adlerbacteria bacterium]